MTDRPQEIRPPKVYGNFRPSLKERSKKHVSSQERREGNSQAHLALVRQLPSCVSGVAGPCDPHHLKSGPALAERSVGRRATDRWAVPLTRAEHDELERISSRLEEAWFRERGVDDVVELAAALWTNTGDLERMWKVQQAHMGRARRGR
jgi:hypothetical protein